MTRPTARFAPSSAAPSAPAPGLARAHAAARLLAAGALWGLACGAAAPLAAQETFSLPPPSPTPAPAPAGPADERAGVAIPPRAVPAATPTPAPNAAPSAIPSAAPNAGVALPPQARPAPPLPTPPAALPTAARPASSPAASPAATPPRESTPQAGASAPSTPAAPPAAPAPTPLAESARAPSPAASGPAEPSAGAPVPLPLPEWWPIAAGALGAGALLGGAAVLWRRRRPRTPRLAAPSPAPAPAPRGTAPAPAAQDPPRLDLALEVVSATRSLMMFTLDYRLTLANRSGRAVVACHAAVQIACARASAAASAGGAESGGGGGASPSAGAAQALAAIPRVGPHQARSVTGTVQLPLSAIAPLRQGQTPLFIPLLHVTLEAEALPARTRTFVVGTPSASGRVHPIALDRPPGGIAGLVAQAVATPEVDAAA